MFILNLLISFLLALSPSGTAPAPAPAPQAQVNTAAITANIAAPSPIDHKEW
jgi:hypothetical protein